MEHYGFIFQKNKKKIKKRKNHFKNKKKKKFSKLLCMKCKRKDYSRSVMFGCSNTYNSINLKAKLALFGEI